jgi:hypothetical protein
MTRERHLAVASLAKAARRSWDRDRKVTGSYEGSLTMEGILDPTSHRFSRFDGDEDLGGSLPCRKRTRRRAHWARKSGEATGMSEARSRSAPWEELRPRSFHPGREIRGFVSSRRSAEVVSGVVKTLGPPVIPRRAQTLRGVHAAKVAAANRKRARCGYTQVVRVAEVDRTHRASCSPGDRKVSWWHAGR